MAFCFLLNGGMWIEVWEIGYGRVGSWVDDVEIGAGVGGGRRGGLASRGYEVSPIGDL